MKGGTMPLLSFAVAVDTGATDQDSPPQWVKIAAFKQRANDLSGKVAKGGDRVYVEGRLTVPISVYEARGGALGKIGRRRPRQPAQNSRPQAMQTPAGRRGGDA